MFFDDLEPYALARLVFNESFSSLPSGAYRAHEFAMYPMGLKDYEDDIVHKLIVNTCEPSSR